MFLTREGAATLDRLEAIPREHAARFVARVGGAESFATLLGLPRRGAERELEAE